MPDVISNGVKFIEENKKKLEQEVTRLRKLLAQEGKLDGSKEFPGEYKPQFQEIGDEEGENALEVSGYEASLGITRDLEEKLNKVEAALKRIQQGTYGKCLMGDEIEEARLQALPEADLCIKHSK
ncbi:MAG: hypothetical protein HY336_01635 [Candidatus Doudnabacteria bacterium]|nr:hypothetical protein [Candidatus Doudnabacteria bacterium]